MQYVDKIMTNISKRKFLRIFKQKKFKKITLKIFFLPDLNHIYEIEKKEK